MLNAERYSSGISETSRNDSAWPIFMAAPFISPSSRAISSAAAWSFGSAAMSSTFSPRSARAWAMAAAVAPLASRRAGVAARRNRPPRSKGSLTCRTYPVVSKPMSNAGADWVI